jgi:hypothetical protein
MQGQIPYNHRNQFSREVWRNKAEKPRQYDFQGGLKEQSRKTYSSTTFRVVWRGFAPPAAPQAHPPPHTQQISGAFSAGKSGRSTADKIDFCAFSNTKINSREQSGGTKPENLPQYDFQGGLEGLCPSSCAAGATLTTYPANFRRIQRRKERSQHPTPIKLISVILRIIPLDKTRKTWYSNKCKYNCFLYTDDFASEGSEWNIIQN